MCKSKLYLVICTNLVYFTYMIKRDITEEFVQSATEYPVTTILGARQSGKTTLARMTFPDKVYFSLEDPEVRMAAETDPRGFLKRIEQGGILDEIQRLPLLMSYLQGIVDDRKEKGLFILTGSHQPLLHEAISQSLAGRTAMLTLMPFSLNELRNYKDVLTPFELIVSGCYPRLHEEGLNVRRFYNNYLQTYIERDVGALIQLRDLSLFQRFLVLAAGRIGQISNLSSLASDLGASSATIRNWISVLKASFVLFELQPFFENIGKRVIKSSKLYFTDTGLASFLLGIHTAEQASRDPLRGNLYENLIIAEVLKAAYNRGVKPEIYFYRDSHGSEVDLLIRESGKIIPIEIKSASTFNREFLKGLRHFHKLDVKNSIDGMILYNGDNDFAIKGVQVFNPLKCSNLWARLTDS